MRTISTLFALSAPLLASAAPLYRRAPTATDVLVLQFAHVLEALELDFYQRAAAKYTAQDFISAGYVNAELAVEQLQTIIKDEAAHDTALTQALRDFGVEPLQCTFNLDAVLTDVITTMTVARKVEVVGVGAYMGAAGLVSDPRVLVAAASILTIEARHGSVLNLLNGAEPVSAPFDFPLAPEQVLAIAGPFISGCDLGIQPNVGLTITNQGGVGPGTQLTFASPAIDAAAGAPLFCHMILGGAVTSVVFPIDQCVVPAGVAGPVATFIVNDSQPILASSILDQSKTNIVAGPDIVFVDFGRPAPTLAQLILTPGSGLNKDLNGAPPVASVSTNTISPAEASASIGSAGGAPVNAATAAGPLPTIFLGDVVPKMPAPGGEEAAAPINVGGVDLPLPSSGVGAAGLPLPSSGVDVAGLPLPSSGIDAAGLPLPPLANGVDVAGVPLPTPPPAGGAASSGDIVPIAGAEAPASGDIVPTVPSSE